MGITVVSLWAWEKDRGVYVHGQAVNMYVYMHVYVCIYILPSNPDIYLILCLGTSILAFPVFERACNNMQ